MIKHPKTFDKSLFEVTDTNRTITLKPFRRTQHFGLGRDVVEGLAVRRKDIGLGLLDY